MSGGAANHVDLCVWSGSSSRYSGRVYLLSRVRLGTAGGFPQPGEAVRRPNDRDPCHASGTEIIVILSVVSFFWLEL